MKAIDETAFINDALALAETGQLYRLIDPANTPGRCLTGEALKDVQLVRNPFFAQTPSQKLYLQSVDSEAAKEMEGELLRERNARSSNLLEPVPFCGWLVSRYPCRTLATYLSKQLSQQDLKGNPALLRFYDPRVLQQLPRILEPSQLSALLGPVDRWVYLDKENGVREIAPHRPGQRHLGRLHLTAGQWQAIRRIGQINRCLERYWALPEEDQTVSATDSLIDNLLVAAGANGLTERADMTAFVLHGLVSHVDFHRHPLMQNLLRQAGCSSYIGLTNRLTDKEWEVISTVEEIS